MLIFSLIFNLIINNFNFLDFNYSNDPVLENYQRENLKKISTPVLKKEKAIYNAKAENALVIDSRTNNLLTSKKINEKKSIASITKLMTALVFLDLNIDFEKKYQIQKNDLIQEGRIYLYPGDEVSIKDLFFTSLIASANTATNGLVNSSGLSQEEFVFLMNEKAKEMGLENTNFRDPTGLNNGNISTALDIANLAKIAFSHPKISEIISLKEYELQFSSGKSKIVKTTDYLLDSFIDDDVKIIGGKTGYTEAAGYCFVAKFTNEKDNQIISVVLESDTGLNRFHETKEMVRWVYKNYEWY